MEVLLGLARADACSSSIGCIQRRPPAARPPLPRRLVLPHSVPAAPGYSPAAPGGAGPPSAPAAPRLLPYVSELTGPARLTH